jgi:serine/threonine protein phosphatase 1
VRYYVIADIHGEAELLRKALTSLYEWNPKGGKIIFLGDYIDRGPDAKGVCDIVMNPPEGWEFIALMGNHEEMFVNSFLNRDQFYDPRAFRQFVDGAALFDPYDMVYRQFPTKYTEWMKNLPLFHFEDNNVFAHAWWEPGATQEEILWTRLDDWKRGPKDKYLIHGHTPRRNGPCETTMRTNLDCGAVFYGRLVVAEMKQGVMGPVWYHEFHKEDKND